MLKHHENAFSTSIDKVVRHGANTLSWDDLHTWFNTDEIDETVWRAIYAKFNELWAAYEWGDLPDLHVVRFEHQLTLMRDAAEDEDVATFNDEGDLEESEEDEEDEDGEEDADDEGDDAQGDGVQR